MSASTAGWSRSYSTALRKHIERGQGASLLSAKKLGRDAVVLGLETLDLARFHEQALSDMASTGGASKISPGTIDRAGKFFAETIVSIEKTHHAALKADVHVNRLTRKLLRRTVESLASKRHLKQGVARRKASEEALEKSGKHHVRLLRKLRVLQNRMRSQTRKILSSQENERRKSSRKLRDEIAQILVAIDLRLLTVTTSTNNRTENLEKDIAETQLLVQQSIKAIQRLSKEFG